MVYEKPYAYREPMYASEDCQWCGEPYFAISAILIGDILPQIPRQGMQNEEYLDTFEEIGYS
jgi:hypothetical protein